jgi:hypothetical protein
LDRRTKARRTIVRRRLAISHIVAALACALVLKTAGAVLLSYADYLPPDFRSSFLLGRQDYFFGPYQWAFYAHITSGPFVLVSGLVLLFDSIRLRFPAWHRRLGRIHASCVLFVVAPSGLWMAAYAPGFAAALAFATLAIATGICTALGWRAAVRRLWRTRSGGRRVQSA